MIQNLLPVMRELGLVTIFWGCQFFEGPEGLWPRRQPADEWYIRRIGKFLQELIWMACPNCEYAEHVPPDA